MIALENKSQATKGRSICNIEGWVVQTTGAEGLTKERKDRAQEQGALTGLGSTHGPEISLLAYI